MKSRVGEKQMFSIRLLNLIKDVLGIYHKPTQQHHTFFTNFVWNLIIYNWRIAKHFIEEE